MTRCLVALLSFFAAPLGTVHAADWVTLPGRFSHEPLTGRRTAQYAAVPNPVGPAEASFRVSGYTHTRSSLNFGQSADNYHRVESFGPPVTPYGQWRFPFRPYGSPYQDWGSPLAGFGADVRLGGGGYGLGPGRGHRQEAIRLRPGFGPLPHPYPAPQWPGSFGPDQLVPPTAIPQIFDGYHPVYRD